MGFKHPAFCDCPDCFRRKQKQQERERMRALQRLKGEPQKSGKRKSKGGLHAGRPHTSPSDSRIHVTTTLRHSNGKQIRKDEHHSSLGAIAHGWVAFEDSQEDDSDS